MSFPTPFERGRAGGEPRAGQPKGAARTCPGSGGSSGATRERAGGYRLLANGTTRRTVVRIVASRNEVDSADRPQNKSNRKAIALMNLVSSSAPRSPHRPSAALLFERCELFTHQLTSASNEDFGQRIEEFVERQRLANRPWLTDEPEVDTLVSTALKQLGATSLRWPVVAGGQSCGLGRSEAKKTRCLHRCL